MPKQIFNLLMICALLFSDCKKSSSGQSATQLLTSAAWKYDTGGLDIDKNGSVDTPFPPGFIKSCETDNTLTFKSDGTGTVDEGATKCNSTDPQTSPFTWSFKNNNTIINFPDTLFGTLGGDVKVNSLTSSKLELQKEVNITSTTTANVILDLKH